MPGSFSPDGKRLAYWHAEPPYGLWTVALDSGDPEHPKAGKPEPLISAKIETRGPNISPDGRWMAYASYESGKLESYVRPYPGPGRQRQISTDGGPAAIWSPGGRQLIYFTTARRIQVVEYSSIGDSFSAGQPHSWPGQPLSLSWLVGIMPDGKQLVVTTTSGSNSENKSTRVVFLLNFFEELQRRLPTVQ
jgi:hypothetical protein